MGIFDNIKNRIFPPSSGKSKNESISETSNLESTIMKNELIQNIDHDTNISDMTSKGEVRLRMNWPTHAPPKSNWVNHWINSISSDGDLPPEALNELIDQCNKISNRIPAADKLTAGETHKGLVIGSVQSGKTAAMIGISAHAIDKGYDLIIILSGTKQNLRNQTAKRFIQDLLNVDERDEYVIMNGDKNSEDFSYTPSQLKNADGVKASILEIFTSFKTSPKKIGLISIIKNASQINELVYQMSSFINYQNSLSQYDPDYNPRELSILILDDEQDEGGASTANEVYKAINQLFTYEEPGGGQLRIPWKTTYVGFTATPQATLGGPNDLGIYPDDFIHVLRYPAAYGGVEEESEKEVFNELTTYDSDNKLKGWYCGGWLYHEWLEFIGKKNFLMPGEVKSDEHNEDVDDLVRAYLYHLVSGTIRAIMHKGIFPGEEDTSQDNFKEFGYLPPHSCMINTSKLKSDHHKSLNKIIEKVAEKAENPINEEQKKSKEYVKNPEIVEAFVENTENWLINDDDMWEKTYDEFKESYNEVNEIVKDVLKSEFPDWDAVKNQIPRIIKNNKMRAIHHEEGKPDNSKINYDVRRDSKGNLVAPEDCYAFLVGGMLLSRGITIKGLCTTLFTSYGGNMDTAIQRQRWFGYRGSILPFCRVLIPDDLQRKFATRNAEDEELKQFHAECDYFGYPPNDPKVRNTFISGGKISGKLGNVKDITLSGEIPWIDCVQLASKNADLCDSNFSLVENLATKVVNDGIKLEGKGYILGQTINDPKGETSHRMNALDVAEFLDKLQYDYWNPDPEEEDTYADLINKICKRLDIEEVYVSGDEDRARTSESKMQPDPYFISAYLKLWHRAWELHNNTNLKNIEDIEIKKYILHGENGGEWDPIAPPKFNVILRSVERETNGSLTIAGEKINFMRRTFPHDVNKMSSRWGGQSYGEKVPIWDKWSDWGKSKAYKEQMSKRRSIDQPGLLFISFLNVNSHSNEPPVSNGHSHYHKPVIGLSIPKGGPTIRKG